MRELYLLYFSVLLHLGSAKDERGPESELPAGPIVMAPKRSPMGMKKIAESPLVMKKVAPPKKKKSPKIGLPQNRDLFNNLECVPVSIFEFESMSEWGVKIALENELKDGALLIEIFQNQNSIPILRSALWSWYWTREELNGYSTNGFIPYPVLRNPVQILLSQRKHQLTKTEALHLFRIKMIEESGFEETVILDDILNSTSGNIELRVCLIDSKGNNFNAQLIDLAKIEGKS